MSLSAKTDDKLEKAEKKLEQLETDWKQREQKYKEKKAEYLKEISELKQQIQEERSNALGEILAQNGLDINAVAGAIQSGNTQLLNLLSGQNTESPAKPAPNMVTPKTDSTNFSH